MAIDLKKMVVDDPSMKGYKEIDVASGDTTLSKVKNKGIWKRFFHMCKAMKIPYLLICLYFILTLLQSTIIVKIPEVNGNFFAGDANVESVSLFLLFEIISMIIGQIVLFVNHVLRAKFDRNLRNVIWEKVIKLKPRYFDKVSSNTLISRITVDTESINGFFMDVILEIFSQVYLLVLTIYEMSKISIKAGMYLLAFVPLYFLFDFIVGRLTLKLNNKITFKMSDLTSYLSELVSSLPLLKAYNKQAYEEKRGRKVIDDYYRASKSYSIFVFIKESIGTIISSGPEIVIILLGIKMLGDGTLTGAGWYTFYLYVGTFIGFVATMGSIWDTNKRIQGNLNKVADIIDEEEERIDDYVKEIIADGDIIFDQVSFAYEEELVIKDVSFTIPKDKNTVIIGYSGSGKSTILKLLERIYQPSTGRILMSGENFNDYSIRQWRNRVAIVSQNTPLLSGTIRENILYGIKRDVSDSEIMNVAELTHLSKFIQTLPEGLDYQVGQFGDRLSGGQRQKIAVARAILSNVEFLFLDEPTASLDIISTNEIINTISKLSGTRTVVVITHDKKMISLADNVIAIDKEHHAVYGTPKELAKTNEFYRNFMEREEKGHED